MNIGEIYLLMEKRRIDRLIYIEPGQRILAVKPPYYKPVKRRKELVIPMSIVELREVLANS
ncbi:hypothetical protein ES702_01547 [subsurface metagenome]